MLAKDNLYFCFECKKLLVHFEELTVVEKEQGLVFCTDECVHDFFHPLQKSFKEEEKHLRMEWKLPEERVTALTHDSQILKETFRKPSRIMENKNLFNLKTLTFMALDIPGHPGLISMLSTLICDNIPTVILWHRVTESRAFADMHCQGVDLLNKGKIREGQTEKALPHQESAPKENPTLKLEEHRAQSKSLFLSEILEKHDAYDISFEDYHRYLQYERPTIEGPDEVYAWYHNGDPIATLVKSFELEGTTFFYLTLGFFQNNGDGKLDGYVSLGGESWEKKILPVISFPTVDGKLYQHFCRGRAIIGGAKN